MNRRQLLRFARWAFFNVDRILVGLAAILLLLLIAILKT